LTLAPCTAPFPDLAGAAEPPQAQTSRGPVSEEEGDLLWNDGREAAEAGRCAEAAPKLQRLVDRYPGHAGYVLAHLLLGQCLLQLDDFNAAIASLRFFTSGSASETTPQAHDLLQRGRVTLGRAYLAAGRGHEAYLTASEIARHVRKQPDGGAETSSLEGLLIRSRALILMNQDDRALETLDSASAGIKPGEASLAAEAAWTRMKLVSRRCARLPGKGGMDEAQVRDQLGRRGGCVLEATVIAREALMTGATDWAKRVEEQAVEVVGSFHEACTRAPDPPRSKPRRTAEELRKYRAELADVMARDCAGALKGAVTMLDGWKDRVPTQSAPYLKKIRSAYAEQLSRLDHGAAPGGAGR